MPTPDYALPYPADTDFLIDGASAIQNLAEAVDVALGDNAATAAAASAAASAAAAAVANRVRGGVATDGGSVGGAGFAINFASAMPSVPGLVIRLRQPGATVTITAVTVNGFTYNQAAAAGTNAPLFDWVAAAS